MFLGKIFQSRFPIGNCNLQGKNKTNNYKTAVYFHYFMAFSLWFLLMGGDLFCCIFPFFKEGI